MTRLIDRSWNQAFDARVVKLLHRKTKIDYIELIGAKLCRHDRSYLHLFLEMSNLRLLDLSRLQYYNNDSDLVSFVHGMNLSSLDLSAHERADFATGKDAIFKKRAHALNLPQFSLQNMPLTDMLEAMRSLPCLTDFNLNSYLPLFRSGVERLAHLQQLRALDLRRCHIADDFYPIIFHSLKGLSHLKLEDWKGFQDLGFIALCSLKNLRYLEVLDCTLRSRIEFLPLQSEHLESLYIHAKIMMHPSFPTLLSGCTRLRALRLTENIRHYHDHHIHGVLRRLAQSVPSLVEISYDPSEQASWPLFLQFKFQEIKTSLQNDAA